jgi:hypothetical protein
LKGKIKVDKDTLIEPDMNELAGLYRAFKTMDKEAKTDLKNKVSAISAWTVPKIQNSYNMNPYPKQARKALTTARAGKRKDPIVAIGGARGKYSGGGVSGNIIFGSEFGANPTSVNGQFPNGGRRFPMPRKGGFGIFSTLKTLQPEITRRWKSAVDDVLGNWTKG